MRKQDGKKTSALRRRIGGVAGGIALVAAAVVAGAWVSGGPADGSQPVAQEGAATGGWGSEVLATFHDQVLERAPVNVANACGLGATSCFKCHNKGRRGPAPSMDEAKSPWHPQHMEVNHSCDGCHNGNPRLMVKGMAHREMIADPRTKPDKSCATCHSDGEISELLGNYKQ
jgi:hypothetical protein